MISKLHRAPLESCSPAVEWFGWSREAHSVEQANHVSEDSSSGQWNVYINQIYVECLDQTKIFWVLQTNQRLYGLTNKLLTPER